MTDARVRSLVAATVDRKNSNEWYWALMDYGVFLKKQFSNPSRRSAHHTRQSKFEGSDRQIRGAIVRNLTVAPGMTAPSLIKKLDAAPARARRIIAQLQVEGFIAQRNRKYSIV